ncbi:hypothetical protein [Burkholderia sp. 22313]|uniref:hypothetical protein n=1 Tax=Burkholderia sp. 22313 TaxID=3453908 RepID=UPI002CFA3AD6|nr:hypothetical protein [Burkholderia sp.]
MKSSAMFLVPALVAGFVFSGPAQAADKKFCYIHHNCPDDGKMPSVKNPALFTKRQCANQPKGKSWGDGPAGKAVCENVN